MSFQISTTLKKKKKGAHGVCVGGVSVHLIILKIHLLQKGFYSYLEVVEGVREAGEEEEGNKSIMYAYF